MTSPYDELADAVLVLDDRITVVDANGAACRMLGHRRDELVGADAEALLRPRGRDGARIWADGWPPSVALTTVSGVPEQTVHVRRADGTDMRVAVTGRYVRATDGSLTRAVLTLRRVHRRELEGASGIEVVSTVSHELRSPLTSVKGFVSLMLNRWDRLEDAQKREMLEQVHLDADRVTRLVTELLDISRLETGRLRLRRQMVALGPLVDKAVTDVRHLYEGFEPQIVVPETVPDVYADPDKIMQVLTNLVENTAKYADGKGVRVALEHDAETDEVRTSVSDAGPGIPTDDLERVFTKFYRSGEGRPTGSGLGLYIAKGIVEAHGGAMSVVSAAGSGCTFSFTLPAGIPDELDASAAGSADGGR